MMQVADPAFSEATLTNEQFRSRLDQVIADAADPALVYGARLMRAHLDVVESLQAFAAGMSAALVRELADDARKLQDAVAKVDFCRLRQP